VARAAGIAAANPPAEEPVSTTNKLARLTEVRESFRALATGDPATALRAAKRITDETERETALFTLVTEWTQGEINPPGERAGAIVAFGLEAGLGLELAKFPELAVLWANELTDGAGRTAVLQQAAVALLDSNPSGAFALSEQFPRRTAVGSLIAYLPVGRRRTPPRPSIGPTSFPTPRSVRPRCGPFAVWLRWGSARRSACSKATP